MQYSPVIQNQIYLLCLKFDLFIANAEYVLKKGPLHQGFLISHYNFRVFIKMAWSMIFGASPQLLPPR